jgi:hypothetical protein
MSDSTHQNVRRTHCEPLKYIPSAADVEALIAAARQHPLGLDFLRDGALDCVAVTFRTHAFTVVAARERLALTRQ